MNKLIGCGVIAGAMVVVVGGCALILSPSSSTPTKLDPKAPASSTAPGITAPNAPETFAIGDRVKMGNQVLTVIGGRVLPAGMVLSPKDGHVWLAVECMVENAGSDRTIVSSMMQFHATDGDGYRYTIAMAEGAKGQLDGEVPAGEKIRGEVVFEVPRGAKDLRLLFQPGITGATAVVKLGDIITKQ